MSPSITERVMADDDLLGSEEIESLLKSAGPGSPGASASAPDSPSAPGETGVRHGTVDDRGSRRRPTPEQLLDQAEANLRAAVAPIMNPARGLPPELGQPKQFAFPSLAAPGASAGDELALKALNDVELDLRVELGRAELLIEEVLKLREGSVVPLDKLAGDPVDILVNGRLIARGEVLVLNDSFCVRVAEVLTPES